MITTGKQIRAARAMLGLRVADLAKAASLHPNAVLYWERHAIIPTGRREPWAVGIMRKVMRQRGIEFPDDPAPAVRFVGPPSVIASERREAA